RQPYLLRPCPRARHRASAVPLDLPALPLRLPPRLPGRDVHPHAAEPGIAAVTPAGEAIASEIAQHGAIRFHRFMELALYHPRHGYYRRRRDPFGKAGDFYTAEQLQPVFGILIASRVRQIYRQMAEPAHFTVVELGAGRGEMSQAFSEWRYVPADLD